MKRWLFYVLLIAAVAFLGGKNGAGTDVASIQPVQVVRISSTGGEILIETDIGERGMGDTLKDALYNMKETASSEVFLDTADYLILSPNCEGLLTILTEYLRPSCSVCLEEGETDLERAGSYLEIHDPGATLKDYRAGNRSLPILVTKEGRMELVS